MTILPLEDYLVLKEITEDLSKSGLVLPENADLESSQKAKVVAVGEKVKNLKADEIVLFKHYGFDEIVVDGEKLRIGKAENVFAKIKL